MVGYIREVKGEKMTAYIDTLLSYCKSQGISEKDIVPVVRCKYCKYYEIAELKKDSTDDKRYKPSVCMKGYYAKPRNKNWFCADGKRKEVDNG